jgi:HD-like signal output (HDOD) protein
MVMAEPQVAAKVLVAVNSPLYGLKAPVDSIAQAITFMGMNSVRGICLQYLLDASFRSDDPEIRKIFERLWQVSALASELCFKLSKRLELTEPGTLVTQVVLSFLGQVASHSLLPRQVVIAMLSKGLLERSRMEQETLGLCAAELGSLLMQEWEVPASIVDRVRAMDMVLLTPCPDKPTARDSAMALCYFSARLAEMLARQEVTDLSTFRVEQEPGTEFFHLQGYLQHPPLARLTECLHEPELLTSIHTMLHAMQS